MARTAGDGPGAGVMKLHGMLVLLQAAETDDVSALASGATFQTQGGRISVRPLAEGEGDLAGMLEDRMQTSCSSSTMG